MIIVYSPRARKAIAKVANYIEGINTKGSGNRWAEKLISRIELLANSKAKFAICNHSSLAKFNYSCYTYKDWVIVFRVTENEFEVCRIVLGSLLA